MTQKAYNFQGNCIFVVHYNEETKTLTAINNYSKLWKIVLSLLLGGLILYWMYRDFNFSQVEYVMLHQTNWWWMLLSFPFGVMAQVFRGLRWRQLLQPLGEEPRYQTAIYAIFMSYAASLVIPRIGEFARCAALKRNDNIPFARSLGTVVTERAIDSVLVLAIAVLTLLSQLSVFTSFFSQTGTRIDEFLHKFTSTGYLVTITCILSLPLLGYLLLKKLRIYKKVQTTFSGIWEGITSVRMVRNRGGFIFYSLAIWGCYFLHYYLTFFCFEATQDLGWSCAMVTFVVGSIAVIVPTPNGAGSWHFAVKTMLILYGVTNDAALYFVLIVHTVQTILVIVLGIIGWTALSIEKRQKKSTDSLQRQSSLY